MKIWTEIKAVVKWLVRVAIAIVIIFLIGAAIAALYRDTAPEMFSWYSMTLGNIF